MPCTNPNNTESCAIDIDGKFMKENVSLRTETYISQNEVFSVQNLEDGKHILKVVNTGNGQLVNDVVRVTKPLDSTEKLPADKTKLKEEVEKAEQVETDKPVDPRKKKTERII